MSNVPDLSPTARLADHLLAEGLHSFVLTARSEGRSWRWISVELGRRTDWVIDVTHETMRSWYPSDQDANGGEGEAA